MEKSLQLYKSTVDTATKTAKGNPEQLAQLHYGFATICYFALHTRKEGQEQIKKAVTQTLVYRGGDDAVDHAKRDRSLFLTTASNNKWFFRAYVAFISFLNLFFAVLCFVGSMCGPIRDEALHRTPVNEKYCPSDLMGVQVQCAFPFWQWRSGTCGQNTLTQCIFWISLGPVAVVHGCAWALWRLARSKGAHITYEWIDRTSKLHWLVVYRFVLQWRHRWLLYMLAVSLCAFVAQVMIFGLEYYPGITDEGFKTELCPWNAALLEHTFQGQTALSCVTNALQARAYVFSFFVILPLACLFVVFVVHRAVRGRSWYRKRWVLSMAIVLALVDVWQLVLLAANMRGYDPVANADYPAFCYNYLFSANQTAALNVKQLMDECSFRPVVFFIAIPFFLVLFPRAFHVQSGFGVTLWPPG